MGNTLKNPFAPLIMFFVAMLFLITLSGIRNAQGQDLSVGYQYMDGDVGPYAQYETNTNDLWIIGASASRHQLGATEFGVQLGVGDEDSRITFDNRFATGERQFTPDYSLDVDLHLAARYVAVDLGYDYYDSQWTSPAGNDPDSWGFSAELGVGPELFRLVGVARIAFDYLDVRNLDSNRAFFAGGVNVGQFVQLRAGTRQSERALADLSHQAYFGSARVLLPIGRNVGIAGGFEYVEDCVTMEEYYNGFIGITSR